MTRISQFQFHMFLSLSFLVRSCLLIAVIKCLKSHKSEGLSRGFGIRQDFFTFFQKFSFTEELEGGGGCQD